MDKEAKAVTTRINPSDLVTPGIYRVSGEYTPAAELVILAPPRPNPNPGPSTSPVVDVITIPEGRRQTRQLYTLGLAPHPTRGIYVATIEFLGVPDGRFLDQLQKAAKFTSTAYKERRARQIATLLLEPSSVDPDCGAHIKQVWVYGGIAIGKEATHDIDLGVFADEETIWRNLRLPMEGRRTLAITSEGAQLHPELVHVLGLMPHAADHIKWLLRGEQTQDELERATQAGDFLALLRVIPKLDVQIWANPMPYELRHAYNETARALGNDPDFPRRMAERIRVYNKDADAFDHIGAHPISLGSPAW